MLSTILMTMLLYPFGNGCRDKLPQGTNRHTMAMRIINTASDNIIGIKIID